LRWEDCVKSDVTKVEVEREERELVIEGGGVVS